MMYKSYYKSPIGKILLVNEGNKLIGLWIESQKYYLGNLTNTIIEKNSEEIFVKVKSWLDRYFNGEKPKISELELSPIGSIFEQNVWKFLCEIPYGEITTYGNIAIKVAKVMNKQAMSAQAVGKAIGHNPISLIIPCHRVLGANGSLTGYASGIDKKIKLLKLEKVNMDNLYVPTKGTAL